jgi:hypothetical protein
MVASFTTESCNGAEGRNLIICDLDYVGIIEDVIILKYLTFSIVLIKCRWHIANHRGPNPTIKNDEYGFTFVKSTKTIPTDQV